MRSIFKKILHSIFSLMSINKKVIIKIILIILLCTFFTLPIIVYGKYPFLFSSNKKNVIILGYHHFVTLEEKKNHFSSNGNVISVDKFEEQLKYLKRKKYNPITIDELYCWLNNECEIPEKSILITIDDGNLSTYKYALPLLEKYNFNGVSFVITSRIRQTTNEWVDGKLVFMGRDIIEDIEDNHKNLVIASHTHNLHRKINDLYPKDVLSLEELKEDLVMSKKILNTDYFAYPFGSYDEKYITALDNSGYKMAFTYGPFRSATKNDSILTVPRISVPGDISMLKFKMYLKK